MQAAVVFSRDKAPVLRIVRRVPLNALALLPFFGGGFPYQNRQTRKNGTLLLTSLLENLVSQRHAV